MKSMNTQVLVELPADTPEPTPAATLETPDTASDTVPDTASATVPETVSDTAPATAPDTASDSAVTAAAPAAPAAGGSPRALLKQLQHQFPTFRDCQPLAIGIDKQLLAVLPGLDRKTMRAALGIHTGSLRYLRTMEKATVRFNLDGSQGAEVSDTHRTHAKETLQQRFKKEAERKKAEREAEREAAKADEAARLRQEKLLQLASKFSKNG